MLDRATADVNVRNAARLQMSQTIIKKSKLRKKHKTFKKGKNMENLYFTCAV
jgi:hypothetical protein